MKIAGIILLAIVVYANRDELKSMNPKLWIVTGLLAITYVILVSFGYI